MITSLTIKDVASYDAVTGVQFEGLKTLNFFFGFNGSGKSTVARYLRDLSFDSVDRNPRYNACSNIGHDAALQRILTFNEDFIEENFKNSPDFKGVFSLNDTNALIDHEIHDEEAAIEAYLAETERYKLKKSQIENDKKSKYELLLNHCWTKRASFATFNKISLAHSGNKFNNLAELRRLLQGSVFSKPDMAYLVALYQNLYEKDLKQLNTLLKAKLYLAIRRLEDRLNLLLETVIIGNESVDVAELVKKLNSRKWVEEGIKYLDQTDGRCPFCQKKTVDDNLTKQFESFFDESYKLKIAELEELKSLYTESTTIFIDHLAEIQQEFNPDNLVSNLLISLSKIFNDNLVIIKTKIDHPNEKKNITSIIAEKKALSKIIHEIKTNNNNYKETDSNKQKLTDFIWKYIGDECRAEIQTFDQKELKYQRIHKLCNDRISIYTDRISNCRDKIELLRSQTVNTKEAVDNINTILKNAGYEGFVIKEKDKVNNISTYFLKRPQGNNTSPVFNSLSEGEKNFISFLYFYQLCLGTDDLSNNARKKKIIVIDDPVSSLDSQALFIVSTLIRALLAQKDKANRKMLKNSNLLQAFVFTHNFYFYKEVSFESRRICSDHWHYKISKLNNKTQVTGSKDKVVFDDYTLMWNTLKDIKADQPSNSSLNIMISNTMRRIIETYVNFVGYGKDSWASLINEDPNDPMYYIKCAFISTINDESHKITATDGTYYQKLITLQPQTLFESFASIFKAIGKEHYEMMMSEELA